MRARPLSVSLVVSVAALCAASAVTPASQSVPRERRMSVSNRLLLNRAVVSGLRTIDVLMLVPHAGPQAANAVERTAARVASLGGRIRHTEPAIGYLRVDIPPERLLELVDPAVEAYQIASRAAGTWYRDAAPERNATGRRASETAPVDVAGPKSKRPDLPVLSGAESRAAGFTADDSGVGRWLEDHPTFDGRGVTIALLEAAQPSFDDPGFRTAKTLDGRDVPKIAGIVNTAGDDVLDETRVRLDTIVHAATTWARVGNRTYILPRPGTYRFGLFDLPGGAHVVQRFAIVQHETTGEVWIDATGDASFQDEQPLADVNERFEPRYLTVIHPTQGRIAFVMARGAPGVVHIYIGRGSHQTMTVGVAAGSHSGDSLARGVAPNARVLLVRSLSLEPRLTTILESFLAAAQRPDVDVIGTSWGAMPLPDTDADFSGTFFRRLAQVYRKPIINSAGNRGPAVGSAAGSMLSVGGVISPATWAAFYGGRSLPSLIVHPISAAGPALDGAIKPDFLAPVELLAADLPWNANDDAIPLHSPERRLPPGYQIACCTSSSSPYATGIVALLISAAKQSGVPHSVERLSDALRFSARLIPGAPAHRQGNGLIDVEAAWRALRETGNRPLITASTAIVHPLAQYAEGGEHGSGIFEFGGWTPGAAGTRTIALTRESGPEMPVTYRVGWAASDGSFTAPPTITLPLRQPISIPVRIDVRGSGVHSGLLQLRDITNGASVFRTQATIVAADRVDPVSRSLRTTGTLENLSHRSHYVHVPAGTAVLSFELEIGRGVVRPTLLPPHGLYPAYYPHLYPTNVFHAGTGTHVVRVAHPLPGPWTLQVETDSAAGMSPAGAIRADDGGAEYTVTARLQDDASVLAEPALDVTAGYLTSHHERFLPSGLPNVFDIDVPRDASTLSLRLRTEPGAPKTELFLYDCTTGECFSYNIGFPAAGAHTLVVRKPAPGRWKAAVNTAPFPSASGSFVLDELVAIGPPVRRVSAAARGPRARWREAIGGVAAPPPAPGKSPVAIVELIDLAAERAEVEHPWSTAPNYVKLRDRPIALGTAVYPR
jgi:hypothetical protein